jgi:hypothetical protein
MTAPHYVQGSHIATTVINLSTKKEHNHDLTISGPPERQLEASCTSYLARHHSETSTHTIYSGSISDKIGL